MKSRLWCVALVGAGMALLTAAVSLHVRGEHRAPALRHGLTDSRQDGVILSGPDVDALRRVKSKDRMVYEIIAGRKSLLDAAARLRRLDNLSPRWSRATKLFPDAASEEEAYCRAIIACVAAEVGPKWGKGITTGLQAELEAKLRNGTLHFNDAGPTAAEAYPPETKETPLFGSASDESADMDQSH
jgi:hypothetical protein